MKPLPRIKCRCSRGFACWLILDLAGKSWLCDACRDAYWNAYFAGKAAA